jgi:hypothetical protein
LWPASGDSRPAFVPTPESERSSGLSSPTRGEIVPVLHIGGGVVRTDRHPRRPPSSIVRGVASIPSARGGSPPGRRLHRSGPFIAAPGLHPSAAGTASRSFHPRPSSRREPSSGGVSSIPAARRAVAASASARPAHRHQSGPSIAAPGHHPCRRGVGGLHPSVAGTASRSFHPRPSSRREPSSGGVPSILSARSAPVGAVRRRAPVASASPRSGCLPMRRARSSFFPRCCLLRVRNPIT